MKYKEYLQSEHWKKVRTKKLKPVGHKMRRCSICGKRWDLQVHHLQYRNWYQVKSGDLRRLCSRCHCIAHKLMKEGNLNLGRAKKNSFRFALTRDAVIKYLKESGQWVNHFKVQREMKDMFHGKVDKFEEEYQQMVDQEHT